MNQQEKFYLSAFSSTDLITPKRYRKIKSEIGDLELFWKMSDAEKVRFLNIRKEDAENIFSRMSFQAEAIIKYCDHHRIKMISIDDPAYPPILKNIDSPPYMLYVRGNLNYSIPMIAVVGTRRPTSEGRNINRQFTQEFIDYQMGIVSGMAAGHDTISQNTVIENHGYTIAVLGSGIDEIYPASNTELYHSIIEQGAVISEYPPWTKAARFRFPQRNRIISGLSRGILIVEAPEKSGALYTAKYAADQSRDLFVIPGNPGKPECAGTNRLIQEGAKIALSPLEIIEDLLGKNSLKLRQAKKEKAEPPLSAEEQSILDYLQTQKYIDEITDTVENALHISSGKIIHLLTLMELRGLVIQHPGRFYERVY